MTRSSPQTQKMPLSSVLFLADPTLVLRGPKGHARLTRMHAGYLEPLSSRGMNVYHVARLVGLLYRDRHARRPVVAVRQRRKVPSLSMAGKFPAGDSARDVFVSFPFTSLSLLPLPVHTSLMVLGIQHACASGARGLSVHVTRWSVSCCCKIHSQQGLRVRYHSTVHRYQCQ